MRARIHVVAVMALLGACASGEPEQATDVGSCQPPREVCDGVCVDLESDPQHCGRCGLECELGMLCRDGLCSSDCLDTESLCGGSCVDTDTDQENCGRCDYVCPSEQICRDGDCFCADGRVLCESGCVDIQTDDANCGRCGRACKEGEECFVGGCVPVCSDDEEMCNGVCSDTTSNASTCGDCDTQCDRTEVCDESVCVCADGRTECGGACVDTTTNSEHCGQCERPCPAGAVCSDSSCACPPGRTLCDDLCVDTQTDPDYCGNCETDCGDDLCVDGDCAVGCPGDQDLCGDECVDLDTSTDHCGICSRTCRLDQECDGGVCACPVGFLECDGRCVDIDRSQEHCGGCDRPCVEPRACQDGACGCGALTECDGICVDTETSGRHCGRCDNECSSLEVCSGGDCTCIDGLTRCGDACVRTTNNPDHCGSCDRACAEAQLCSDGDCVSTCAEGELSCDGACVDPQTDREHCGDCDRDCTDFETCSGGECSCLNDHFEYEYPDPTDSIEQAIEIQNGVSGMTPIVSALRLCGDDVDWYALYLPTSGASVEAHVDADCADTILPRISLWDADGRSELDAAEADGSGSCPFVVGSSLAQGWVHIKVENTAGEGPYDLYVFTEDFVEEEPNEDPDNANGPFSSDFAMLSELDAAGGDFDTTLLFVPRMSTVFIETSDGSGSCETDTVIYVNDEHGVFVGEDDNGGNGSCSSLAVDVPRGWLYVTVYGYEPWTSGLYELDVYFDYDWETEPNGGELAEGPFSGSFGVEGTIFPAYDVDNYEIELISPSTIVASVNGPVTDCLMDSIITLYAGDSELGSNDDFPESGTCGVLENLRGLGCCSRIDPTDPDAPDPGGQDFAIDLPAGTYTLSVSGYFESTGAYNLDVDVISQ